MALIVALSCFVIGASAASANFTIEDGVLLSYSGDSSEITVPGEVYRISDGVFEGNTSLKSVTLPSSVIEIGNRAFYGCSSLVEVKGGENVYSVGSLCFEKTPYFFESTEEFFTLGKTLLWYNGDSAEVTLPQGISAIAPYAFLRSSTLGSFSATDDLTMIGEGAFYECTHLSRLSISESVEFIDAYAFFGTPYQAQAGEYVILGKGILTAYNGSDTDLTIPNNVRAIAPRTFYGNADIEKVSLPSSVYTVGRQAFAQCSKIEELSLSTGLVHIGEEAFLNNTSLKKLSFPSTTSLIGKGAFLNCSSLEELSLCGTSLSVSYGAFSYCSSLKTVLMSDGVASVYDRAFYRCNALKAVSVSGETLRIPASAFSSCPKFLLCSDPASFAARALSGVSILDRVKGDSDRDGVLSVLDATYIQKYMASLATLGFEGKAASDIDYDGYVSVLDATRIQKILANLV